MIENALEAQTLVVHNYQHAAEIALKHRDIGLCLLDIHIPGDDARTGIKALQMALPKARFMLFSGSADEADLMMALDLQMHGFLPKSSAPPVAEAAVRLVMAGGVYLPSGIGELAMRNANAVRSSTDPIPATAAFTPLAEAGHASLTSRQIMVLEHVSAGRSNKEIARELDISPATVKVHVAQIIAVLGVANRIEAGVRARALGLIGAS